MITFGAIALSAVVCVTCRADAHFAGRAPCQFWGAEVDWLTPTVAWLKDLGFVG